ncbi:MAG: hypothetical protein WCD47_12090 [Candidatus Sulfotelmatobacter sp.]
MKTELLDAKSIKLATAFAHWTGWKHFGPHILKTSANVKLLSGLSFCQTEPDVLYDWLQRAQKGRVQARLFTDAKTTFHPKVLLVNGGRALASVLSRNVSLRNRFNEKFGGQYRTVRDYYLPRKGLVVIQDVSSFVPELVAAAVEAAETEEE